jgi:hypothetical protein
MDSIILTLAGIYFLMVGIQGNALNFFAALAADETFLYWIIAILVITALWETDYGAEIAKPAALLIVLGFLLASNSASGEKNYVLIANGFKNVLPGL